MHFVLIDYPQHYHNLLPLTFTRPISQLRIGILQIFEKWQQFLPLQNLQTVPCSAHLHPQFFNFTPTSTQQLYCLINSAVLPTPTLLTQITNLAPQHALICPHTHQIIAFTAYAAEAQRFVNELNTTFKQPTTLPHFLKKINTATHAPIFLEHSWDFFKHNDFALKTDFELLTKHQQSQPISTSNRIIGNPELVFLAHNATLEACTLNTQNNSPIYIAEHAEVMENCAIRGGLALNQHACIRMGTRIYGATTVGAFSKVGGEISNSVIMDYSNKVHDGFLGNSVLGNWCNLGADTNNSNLKNNYSPVQCWNYPQNKYIATGLQFCGITVGDHSKTGINTMLNTGTVIGVCCNVFGAEFPPKFVPCFTWGSALSGFETHHPHKAIQTAQRVYERRNKQLSQNEIDILNYIFEKTQPYRNSFFKL